MLNVDKFIIVTGPIGVGKTFFIHNRITKFISTKSHEVILEYITTPFGRDMLKLRSDGVIGVDTFQNYICDYYANQLSKLSDSSYDYVVMERSLDDIVNIFSDGCYDINPLRTRCDKLNKQYNLSTYRFHQFNTSCYYLKDVIKMFDEIDKSDVKVHIIGLYCDRSIMYERVCERGDYNITPYDLSQIDEKYKTLYDHYKLHSI